MSVSEYVRFFKKIITLLSSFSLDKIDSNTFRINKPSRFYDLCPKNNYDIDKTLETIVLNMISKEKFQSYISMINISEDCKKEQENREIIIHMFFTYVLRFVGLYKLSDYNRFPVFKEEFIDIVCENYMENYDYNPYEPEDYDYDDEIDNIIDENDSFYQESLCNKYPIKVGETYKNYCVRLTEIVSRLFEKEEESDCVDINDGENDNFYMKLIQKKYPIQEGETFQIYSERVSKVISKQHEDDYDSDDGSVSNTDE